MMEKKTTRKVKPSQAVIYLNINKYMKYTGFGLDGFRSHNYQYHQAREEKICIDPNWRKIKVIIIYFINKPTKIPFCLILLSSLYYYEIS